MLTDTLKKIEVARAQLALLEAKATADLNKDLAALPARYGFSTLRAFIKAVKVATGGSPAERGRKSHVREKVRKRAKITRQVRAEVKRFLAVKKTGAEIAATVGISVASVQNIKKALGWVKERK